MKLNNESTQDSISQNKNIITPQLLERFKNYYYNKNILVIGGTGTIGTKLVRMLLDFDPKVVRILSRDEHKQYELERSNGYNKKVRYLIGDVRDEDRINRASEDINIIFNLAAMKHVPACEYNPFEAVKTNVIGAQNVINSAIKCGVEKVVLTSSDKAINPSNAMGATKLLAERLFIAANSMRGPSKTCFISVRFGNVLGSRGSIIPLFKNQILESSEITLTDGTMTRFMMSISEAAALTLNAAMEGIGGEIFIPEMPVLNIGELADIIIEKVCKKHSIDINSINKRVIGLRTGEKHYEELMTEEESVNSYSINNLYITLPLNPSSALKKKYSNFEKIKTGKYSSDNIKPISKKNIAQILDSENLI